MAAVRFLLDTAEFDIGFEGELQERRKEDYAHRIASEVFEVSP